MKVAHRAPPAKDLQHLNSHASASPLHPWVLAACVVIFLTIIVLAVFWLKKWRSNHLPRHEYSAVSLETVEPLFPSEDLQSYQKYFGEDSRYRISRNLGLLGFRKEKIWFSVKDTKLNAERLLTVIPNQDVALSKRPILQELFRTIHHPYILPILDIDFWDIGVALISPLSVTGSLKDLIYGCEYSDLYGRKYHCSKGTPLPFKQVQYLGRQILEALLFLRSRHFPNFDHLHSGNVIIQNGVARLTALENPLLFLPPRTQAPVDESLAFGYLIHEMITGYELPGPFHLKKSIMDDLENVKMHELVEWIFEMDLDCGHSPSIDDLLRHEAFKGVELRELRRTTGISYSMSQEVTDLLALMNEQISSSKQKSNGPESDEDTDVEMLDVRHSVLEEERKKTSEVKNRCSSR